MTLPYSVRPCTEADVEAILSLLAQLWPNNPRDPVRTKAVYDRALASSNQLLFCAVADDRAIGFGSLTLKNNLWQEGLIGNVDELVVDEKHRGRGVGKMLMKHLTAVAREHGCKRIELDSSFHRHAAHEFYKAIGFEARAYLFTKVLPATRTG
jgi:GNAT superfamily N-acetyltransferase